jgi:alpha-D-ribose 1-methylphosphonate 5-triphosphate synthase subunit PhnH
MADFDSVHDIQAAFRGLLDAFAFPGKLVDLSQPASRLAPLLPTTSAPVSLCLAAATLIDNETTYWADEPGVARFLVEWSSTSPSEPATSAFLVVSTFRDDDLAKCLSEAPSGTLLDPHLGATVLVGVSNLDEGEPVTLSGPGLESPLRCRLPAGDRWLTTRNARVSEFPLGIDLAFFDQLGRVVALPRTTRAVRGET